MFRLGISSKKNLVGVNFNLVQVVQRAIELTTIDFTVLEGLRTPERQKILFDEGASKTLNSRHITGHAVDLGAWIDGGVRWDWPLYYKIAQAMQRASIEADIPVVWGGVWDMELAKIDDLDEAVSDYIARRKAIGKKAFIDGPHFELSREVFQ